MAEVARHMQRLQSIAVWDRDELTSRLREGIQIEGFTYDPDIDQGKFSWAGEATFSPTPDEQAELNRLEEAKRQRRLGYELNYSEDDGITTISASVGPKKTAGAEPSSEVRSEDVETKGMPLEELVSRMPVIITKADAELPLAELVQALTDRLLELVDSFRRMESGLPDWDPNLALVRLARDCGGRAG